MIKPDWVMVNKNDVIRASYESHLPLTALPGDEKLVDETTRIANDPALQKAYFEGDISKASKILREKYIPDSNGETIMTALDALTKKLKNLPF